MLIFFTLFALSFAGFLIHFFYLNPKARTTSKVIELLLLYQLIFNLGALGFLSFYGLTFLPQIAADYLNWPVCPFQQELGNVNLAFGVLGILCIWFRDNFWTATIIGASIWLTGDAIGHLYDTFVNHNPSPGNTGLLLYTDFLIPAILVILLILRKKTGKEEQA